MEVTAGSLHRVTDCIKEVIVVDRGLERGRRTHAVTSRTNRLQK
jgi:hypothetical protein